MTDLCNLLEKLNMLPLRKEIKEKGQSLKTQVLMSTTNDLEKNEKLEKYGPDFAEKIFQKILWSIPIKQQFQQSKVI